jgi:hypothetical protein
MSAFNWFNTEARAFDMRTKTLTTASGDITYTAKTGRVEDNFIIDRVIVVTTTATFSMTSPCLMVFIMVSSVWLSLKLKPLRKL